MAELIARSPTQCVSTFIRDDIIISPPIETFVFFLVANLSVKTVKICTMQKCPAIRITLDFSIGIAYFINALQVTCRRLVVWLSIVVVSVTMAMHL